jgi:hypothetical protein
MFVYLRVYTASQPKITSSLTFTSSHPLTLNDRTKVSPDFSTGIGRTESDPQTSSVPRLRSATGPTRRETMREMRAAILTQLRTKRLSDSCRNGWNAGTESAANTRTSPRSLSYASRQKPAYTFRHPEREQTMQRRAPTPSWHNWRLRIQNTCWEYRVLQSPTENCTDWLPNRFSVWVWNLVCYPKRIILSRSRILNRTFGT